jgi:hypothetical protein
MSLKNLKALLNPENGEKPKNGPAGVARARKLDRDSISTIQPKGKRDAVATGDPANIRKSCEQLEKMRKEEPAVRRVIKTAARLADLCTAEDLEVDARVIRDACEATHRIYDTETQTLLVVPDHKTRLAGTTLRRAYVEGTPVKREIVLTGGFTSAEEILAKLQASPEAQRTFAALAGHGIKVISEGQDIEMDVQKTGGQNPNVA